MGTAKLMQNFTAVYSSDDEGKIPVNHKRMAHNQIERRRKVKINNWIYRLGSLLPGVNKDKKPSKNLILEKAVEYIKELRDTNEQLLLGHTSDVQGDYLVFIG
uniref:BHLH domain-containing protein n=1 Tax=Strigamia maritima TaxID=126957 RepID=T1JJ63_STRMM